MDGLILVHKPAEMTSHDVVVRLRKILGLRQIGHFGTLDPLATGLLLIAVGKVTKFFPFFSKLDKAYRGRIRLGFSTDSYDRSGVPVHEPSPYGPTRDEVLSTMKAFEGEIEQTAPPFSAKKYKGRPLYKYARQNRAVELPSFRVNVFSFSLRNYQPPFLDFEVSCSSGTYVRTLAHDLGQRLGCGAHLAELVRTEIGEYRLEDSLDLEKIKALAENGRSDEFLKPIASLLPEFPKIVLNQTGLDFVQKGRPIAWDHIAQPQSDGLFAPGPQAEKTAIFRLFSLDGRLIALAKRRDAPFSLFPFLVLV